MLLGKPFRQTLLDLLLRHGSLCISRFESCTYLLNDMNVIVNVFGRAIIRQLTQKCANGVFGTSHTQEFSTALCFRRGITPKALANFSPAVGAQRQPWDYVILSLTINPERVRLAMNPFRV